MSESVEAIPPLCRIERRLTRELEPVARPTAREWLKAGTVVPHFPNHHFCRNCHRFSLTLRVAEPATKGIIGYILYVPEYYFRIVGAFMSYAIANPPDSGLRVNIFDRLVGDTHGPRDGPLSCLPPLWRGSHASVFHSGATAFPGGNFGAFIKMKSPIPSRRALFDIGLAGPLAGFVALLPIAVVGCADASASSAS